MLTGKRGAGIERRGPGPKGWGLGADARVAGGLSGGVRRDVADRFPGPVAANGRVGSGAAASPGG